MIDSELSLIKSNYGQLWSKLLTTTSENFVQVCAAFSNYGTLLQYTSQMNQLSRLANDDYRGTWLHHLIRESTVSESDLLYAIAVVLLYSGNLYAVKDSDGYTPYALLARVRYSGQGCLSLDIYARIERVCDTK